MLSFKQWLLQNECGTSTGDIAGFSRMIMPLVTRTWVTDDLNPKKKKKKKKKDD